MLVRSGGWSMMIWLDLVVPLQFLARRMLTLSADFIRVV